MTKKKARVRGTKPPDKAKPTEADDQVAGLPETMSNSSRDSDSGESELTSSGPPVAGIGTSAGGLEAFKRFLTAMPPESGVAFVLVPHLDPARESLMVELLARHTKMPVIEAENGLSVEANHVYVIPPNNYMTIEGGVLRLTTPVEPRTSQTTIDVFLRSLADDQHERSICMILSGTGSHGTQGLKAVKAAGGMAMVQDPATAQFPDMPQSGVATGLADYVLPVEQMPEALIKYVQHTYLNGQARSQAARVVDHLDQILALLRARTKFDFRCYRKKLVTRRIERRMGLNHFENIREYLAFLRQHPEEVKLLVKDLFISVTSFFRDPEAFQQLAIQIIAPLVESKPADSTIRIWVPGCATGEEAYSIGILVLEHLTSTHKNCRVQIFATDVDQEALDVGRAGIYSDSIAVDVSTARLSRFFTAGPNHTYQVSEALRSTVIFAEQNLISDAPFSKLDLISCRNLFIYLEPDVQKKILGLFHFGLNERGFLFLGPSETVGRQVDLFEPLSKRWRIYRRIGPRRPDRLQFPILATTPREADQPVPTTASPAAPNLANVTQQVLVEHFTPTAVLINRKHEILYYHGDTSSYLEVPTGPPTNDLLLTAREGLRSQLRGAIQRAIRSNQSVEMTDARIRRGDKEFPLKVTVTPVQALKAPDGLLLVTFEEAPSLATAVAPSISAGPEAAGQQAALRHVENELKATREDLQSTIEEMESSNEELKAANEEVTSMNEELQSSNEELETSKEELHSLNEELITVNSQLQEKVQDLEQVNNDVTNLLACTDIATLFLDATFRIKLFTPNATTLFHLVSSDVGRPLSDIRPRFNDQDLATDAQQVLEHLTPREKEVSNGNGSCWLRRITPYRTKDHRIDGVVLTFVEITARKQADAGLQRLAAIVESSADAITSRDFDGTTRTWNRGAERLYGYAAEEVMGGSASLIIPKERTDEWNSVIARVKEGESVEQVETERLCKNGRRVPVAITASPIRDSSGKVASVSVIARDISERKRAEHALRESEQRFRFMADHAPVMMWISGQDKRCTWFNKPWLDFIGRTLQEELGDGWTKGVHPDDLERCLQTYSEHFEARTPFRMEYRLRRHDGEFRWVLDMGVPLNDPGAEFTGYIGSCIDITDRKHAESALRDNEARLAAILNTAADAVITIDRRGLIDAVNPTAEKMFGYSAAEMIGQNVSVLMPSPYQDEHDNYLRRYLDTGQARVIGIGREVTARRKDGSTFPVDLAVSEVGHLQLFTGILRDISERKELQRQVSEISLEEQRRLGQELHDGTQQELTALTLIAGTLLDLLHAASEETLHDKTVCRLDKQSYKQVCDIAMKLSQRLSEANRHVQQLAHGIMPVQIDANGLRSALNVMAAAINGMKGISCRFTCSGAGSVANNTIATHLYRIAQEAVNNAVRHSQAKQIQISLEDRNGRLLLEVRDNGRGFDASKAARMARAGETQGMGLRLMEYRAGLIGGTLRIDRRPEGGTSVRCDIPVGVN